MSVGRNPSIDWYFGSGTLVRVLVGNFPTGLWVVSPLLYTAGARMTVLVDQAISGSGALSFGSDRVNYALVNLDVIGASSRIPSLADPDHRLRLGFLSFGAATNVIFGTTFVYWSAPIWIDFEQFKWAPDPETDYLANDFGYWASDVRWALGDGTSGWLFVYGV